MSPARKAGGARQLDEWKIIVAIDNTPNAAWSKAWEEATRDLPRELRDARLWFKPQEHRYELWATEQAGETVLRQLDDVLERASHRCLEIVEEAEQRRAKQAERREDEEAEARRLQAKLDSL